MLLVRRWFAIVAELFRSNRQFGLDRVFVFFNIFAFLDNTTSIGGFPGRLFYKQ
jgi:hypothetical protein